MEAKSKCWVPTSWTLNRVTAGLKFTRLQASQRCNRVLVASREHDGGVGKSETRLRADGCAVSLVRGCSLQAPCCGANPRRRCIRNASFFRRYDLNWGWVDWGARNLWLGAL